MRRNEHKKPGEQIVIKGARVNNLKNISLAIPRNKFVVITGLSGSGKSSLAIAIEQRVNTMNPRSTVGTSTEVYEYIKLLYARIGKTFSPKSGKLVKRDSVSDVVDFLLSAENGSKATIFAPLNEIAKNGDLKSKCKVLLQQGFNRVMIDGKIIRIEEALEQDTCNNKELFLVVDRVTIASDDEDLRNRLADSVQTAFFESHGFCIAEISDVETKRHQFSNRFEADGIVFEEPSENFFSFNNPYGACKHCEGFGSVIGIDEDLVVPNKSLSVFEDAIACWRGEKMSEWKNELVMHAYKFDFPIHKPFYELTSQHRSILWKGNRYFKGLNKFFEFVESQNYKVQYRVMMSRYRGKTVCPECSGTRLRKDASYVKVGGLSINDIVLKPIDDLQDFFGKLELTEFEERVGKRLLTEINNRLEALIDVGLGYLTLNRLSSTLSGGESQRINLSTALGSSLVGAMYILDEPSIGLHSRDTQRLIKVLNKLRDLGNTVIVVEHDEEIIRAADEVIDIGPLAGQHGGEVIFQGKVNEMITSERSLTGQYLGGKLSIRLPERRRSWKEFVSIKGARV